MSRAGSVRRLYRTASELQGAKRIHCRGKSFSYLDLTKRAEALAGTLSPILSRYRDRGADRPRVAYCVPETFPYLVAQFSSWMSSATAVPIHPKFPAAETDHVVGDSDPSAIICTESTRPTSEIVAKSRSIPLVEISEDDGAVVGKETVSKGPPDFSHAGNEAMLIYTSGTTGKPKGVVWTHEMVDYQAETMSTAWRWNRSDRILLFLPLDHVHGIMNIAGCAVWNGAELDMMEVFDQHEAWSRIRSSSPPTVFMAVPTVYARMIQAFEQNPDQKSREAASRLRLCVSGSAALQATYFRKWEEITGQRILERYGMSEVGMALSNPYEEERREGWVGKAFPGVRTGILNPQTETRQSEQGAATGELLLSGPGVFTKYWRNDEATKKSFTDDGFFKTGDIVERDSEGWFRILGRKSIDIIKSAGFKISGLEVERELLEHENIAEVAVVGLPSEEFGQLVGAMIVLDDPSKPMSDQDLFEWSAARIARFKVPRVWMYERKIPRNQMGKIVKKEVVKMMCRHL